ncbi:Gfo/Idh/MocA family oxidoreductase [Bacteroides stercorirosoris]|uniref:Glycerol-3-phosphate cytidylyltransferase n=1 Tax=Bacteroides stercorirosoris TaxID=871324 RepID=A0A1M6AVT5_9BACE|nr:Gfo/Idh/MocA family oxidoreductase [Bacteroides stercorirosoris]SHI40521.1 glycerol-3-phosphate cytidylyltransferase [Bacteroides stercorirosoris]
MIKVITYGTYDLLHEGHINLLRRAKELGDYLIVGVTSDSFDRGRGKLNVRNNVLERVDAVKATGYADEIIIEDYVGQKIDDIQKFGIDIFAIGSDWKGKFDYLNEYCKVVYLPRTEGISSTMLRAKTTTDINIGIIGTGRIARRFIPESKYVNGVEVTAVYNPELSEANIFSEKFAVKGSYDDIGSFLEKVDAVYIASPHLTHYGYIKQALLFGKHVLCEIPMVLRGDEAKELYELARKKNRVLLEASKTAFSPAWSHLQVLVKSGVIGEVIDVKASLSKLVSGDVRELDANQAGGSMTELSSFPLMSIVKLLGMDYAELNFHSKIVNGVDVFTRGVINYDNATSSITLGLGVKTEGNLVISGTKGYVLVPSPWWLTSYFEVRYEDQNLNQKYFYAWQGEGLRYEIQEFVSMIVQGRISSYKLSWIESVTIAGIIEEYIKGDRTKILK